MVYLHDCRNWNHGRLRYLLLRLDEGSPPLGLPRWGNYSIRSQVISVDDDGANTHRLLRVPNSEVDQWDATHDDLGRDLPLQQVISSNNSSSEK